MRFFLDNGFLEYETVGTGIPVLFIHGFPLSRKMWSPQLISLSKIASLISIDLRGHGDSYPFDGPYSMELLADDCVKLMKFLNVLSPFVVCGLSMGGYVIMAMYRKYPEFFRGMILTSTRPEPDPPEGKKVRDESIRNAQVSGTRRIVNTMLPNLFSSVTQTKNPHLSKQIQIMMTKTSVQGIIGALQGIRDRPDSLLLLNQISCPVLIVHGTDDKIVPMNEAELMERKISNSRLVKINDAGHLPNLEQPDKYNQAIRDFLRSLS